jgi:uncharacterized protein (DUF4415 family)
MKEKLVSMTGLEIQAKYGNDKAKIRAMLDVAPEFTEEEIGVKSGEFVARGFTAFKEYLSQKESLKPQEPKVSISVRIPQSYAAGLRATGRGWQTRMSEYMVKGIQRGEFGKIVA